MILKKSDFTILEKFAFESQPVGIKYLSHAPEKIERLSKNLTLCEMLKAAQGGQLFYTDVKNHTCDGGAYILGQADVPEQVKNGEFGAGLGLFQDARTASRIYNYLPRIRKGIADYVSFSPLNQLQDDPDVLLILAKPPQAEILLRASSYKTGHMWVSRYSSAVGCGWLFAYPYISGEINFIGTGFGSGMRRRKLFPEGMHLISIPFDLLPSMLQTLQEMPWVPPHFGPDGPEYVKTLRGRLGLD